MLDVAEKNHGGGGWKERFKKSNGAACPKSLSHSPCYQFPPRAYACSDRHGKTDHKTFHPFLQIQPCEDDAGIWVTPDT